MNATADTTDKQGRQYDARGNVRYRIKTTHRGSSSLGPCGVCGKNADEVFLQVQQRRVEMEGDAFWTHHNCTDLFGHEVCLLSARSCS